MKVPSCLLSLVWCAVCAAPAFLHGQVRIVGSDLLGKPLEAVLATEAENRGWTIEIDFSGSLAGTTAMREGTANLAILALPEGAGSLSIPAQSWPLAFEAVEFVVHPDNPVREVDFTQLANMFGVGADASRWGLLGATGNWENRPLRLHALRNSSSLALEIFRIKVLGDREWSESITYWDDREALLRYVGNTPEAVALVSAGASAGRARALSVAVNAETGAFAPSATALLYGDYSLALGYFLVVGSNASEDALAVARFLLGDTVATTLAGTYVPTPESERRQFIIELDVGR